MEIVKSVDVLVIVDDEGIMRPQAGIWVDNEGGKYSMEAHLAKKQNRNDKVIKATIIPKE